MPAKLIFLFAWVLVACFSSQPPIALAGGAPEVPMVLIPSGEFAMGSDRGQDDEQPVHRVSLNAFYLDAYEVTVSHFSVFLRSQKPDPPFKWNEALAGNQDNKPVIGVSWYDARDYCRWVGKRLPTEAEWELAARGTEGRMYPWGRHSSDKSSRQCGPNTVAWI